MTYRLPFILLLLCVLSVVACKGNIEPDKTENIVVEGWIEDGGFPIVMLTTSVSLSDDYAGKEELKKHLINWAKVTISDGTQEVILTGMYDTLYFPPYIYTTGAMRGKTGHTYRLKVEYENYIATATTTILPSVNLDSVTVAPCAESDTLYQLTAHFTDNPDTRNYYLLLINNGLEYSQPLISYMGYLDDAVTASKHISIPVYKEQKLMTNEHYTPYFCKYDTVVVKLAHVNSEAFNYWKDIQGSVSFSTSMFMPVSTNVQSNVTGGIGYWQGYGISTRTVIINNHLKK